MRTVNLFCLFLIGISPLAATPTQEETEIAALTKELVEAATADAGVGKTIQDISKKFAAYDQGKVIEALLPLLKHEKDGVPDKTSYVISDCRKGLKPEHLNPLIDGFRNGGRWLPGTIAAFGTDQAAEFLAKEFRSNPEIYGQVDSSLMRMGEKAVPFLLKEFDEADPEREPRYFEGMRFLFKGDHIYDGMKDKAKSAIPHLLKIAESEDSDLIRRREAIMMIGCVGKAAMPYFPRLQALSQKDPEKFGDAVNKALIASETSVTAKILADQVDAGADQSTVHEIASLGLEAQNVGPRVVGWLSHPNWEIRVMAASTLGAIGYKDARKTLEELLSSQSDWRLAYNATKSLAKLRAIESIPALEEASRNHWFPIVRNGAKDALKILQQDEIPEKNAFWSDLELADYAFVDRNKLVVKEGEIADLKPWKSGSGQRSHFMEFKMRQPALAKKFIEVRATNGEGMLDLGSMIEFPMSEGVLLGASAGEWTGGLQYAPVKGEQRRLLQANISGIEEWKGRTLVASGIYHMGMNEGILHKVVVEGENATLVPWFILPGEPRSLWVTEDEKLVIACIGGTIVFSDEGKFRYYGSVLPEQDKKKADSEEPTILPDPE